MAEYQCPLCGRKMERNLLLFLNHGERHVIDRIKVEHPEWVAANGVCEPCAEYYRKQLSGELAGENIGPKGRQRRFMMGVGMLGLSLVSAAILKFSGTERVWSLTLFLPIFVGVLGLIQARERTCALLAEFGLKNMDTCELKIDDTKIAKTLRRRGRMIFLQSALWAVALTVIFFILS